MPNHLFLLTIGPVQSFISQARKTHDLFAGSRMLSLLCKTGINAALTIWKGHCQIITPKSDPIPDSVPNRFLALVDTDGNEKALSKAAGGVADSIRADFRKLAEDAIKDIKVPKEYFDQIDNHLDIQWLFVPVPKLDDYAEAFGKINGLLAGIKNVREFGQRPETGRKCIVDGELNVKLYRRAKNESGKFPSKLFQDEKHVEVIDYSDHRKGNVTPTHLQAGEGLSAVSFTKRKFRPKKNGKEEFDSTAAIALYDLLHGKKNMVQFEEYANFQGFFTQNFDEQLLFEDNLTEKYFDEHELFKQQDLGSDGVLGKVVKAKKLLHELRIRVDELGKPFTKYYAIIQFDGDNMGEWLSGELLEAGDKGGVDLKKFHEDFTEAVADFAKTVDTELVPPNGRAIFAGGEDFLGLLNLHHLFPTMQWLHEKYMEMVDGLLRKKTAHYRLPEKKMTLSAGVVIAHYKEPLSEVVKAVAAAEKKAKSSGRNRYVIHAMRHSGGNTTYTSPWENEAGSTLLHLNALQTELEHNFSHNFIIETASMLRTMQYLPPDGLLKSELKRTVNRSCKLPKGCDTAVGNLLATLDNLIIHDMPMPNDTHEDSSRKYENISSLLSLADFITRKTR